MPGNQHSTARTQQFYGQDGIINGKNIDKAVRESVDEIVDWYKASLQELSYAVETDPNGTR